ncbi:hypothetical protein [Pseudonocardia spirodelae]|uniref:PE domain-containing protein n=1 Tax=Pseudonocardia spirodelae TaxID=3133431 RepID=A0ABU8T5B1_9PSEU
MDVASSTPKDRGSDTLLVSVSRENVLAVHALLAVQLEHMRVALDDADNLRHIEAPGADPVSADARVLFQAKIDRVLDVHWAHFREVEDAAGRVRDAALAYGHTDDDISAALLTARARA